MHPPTIHESAVTCPHCGFVAVEVMPVDACLYFYECTSCRTLLRPLAGDCCVFCSYGSVKCPPIQLSRGCCGGAGDLGNDAMTTVEVNVSKSGEQNDGR